MKITRFSRALALALGTAASSWACGGEPSEARAAPEPPEPPVTEIVTAESAPVLTPVEGSVVAQRRAEISTRIMARVAEVPVEIGNHVREGNDLIRLGTDDVAAGQAKANAGVQMASAARDEAARHVARMDTLYTMDVVPLVRRDQARLALVQAEAQLRVAEATLREAGIATGYARIVAPFDGTVVSRSVDPGDMAAPGAPLLVVESTGARDAVLAVPLDVAQGLSSGDSVLVRQQGGVEVRRAIRAIASGADQRTRTVEVRVAVPEDWPTGASVTALVPAGSRTTVTVPASAVVRRGQLTGIQVVGESGVDLRWVRLGRATGERVEVLSGLDVGDRIVP